MAQSVDGVHVWLVLWKAARSMERFVSRNVEASGMCMSDFAVLEALLHKGPLAVNTLGQKVLLTSGSITTAVDRLEARGLVERSSDSKDRRARIVHLTGEGRKLIRKLFAQHQRSIEQVTEPLSATEKRQLAELLKKLGKNVEAAVKIK